MKKIKLIPILLFVIAVNLELKAQDNPQVMKYQIAQPRVQGEASPVTWTYTSEKINSKEMMLTATATIKPGWHVYSRKLIKNGPVKTTITFQPSKDYTLIGTTIEPKAITVFDKTFKTQVSYFENKVVFKQKIKLNTAHTTIKGVLEYMAGKGTQNLAPVNSEFQFFVSQ